MGRKNIAHRADIGDGQRISLAFVFRNLLVSTIQPMRSVSNCMAFIIFQTTQ
ncbi:MAG: hypothetical protein ACFNQD_07620 [Prevotella intermedia]